MFIEGLFRDPAGWVVQCAIIVFSICCHEWSHARAALAFGDDTAAAAGHLSLNPLRQMGWMSLAMLAVCGLAWGQVPVSEGRMRGKWAGEWVAAAGPAMNLALWAAFCIAFRAAFSTGAGESWINGLYEGAIVNFALMLLNMLPLPGLDGGRVFLRWTGNWMRFLQGTGGFVVLIFLLLWGAQWLFGVAAWATDGIVFIGIRSVPA